MNGEIQERKYKYQGIQILRAIACCFVVLCHTSLKCSGAFGVDIFMVIMGFMLLQSTENKSDNFMKKRIIRIIPLYWFMTIITSILVCYLPSIFNSYEFSWIYLMKSLLFIPYEHSGILQPIYGLGWTLNYEMFFYMIFWISMRISKKYRALMSGSVALILVIVANFFRTNNFFVKYYGSTIILEVIMGMLIWYFVKRYENVYKKVSKWNCFIFAVLILCLLWIFQVNSCRGIVSGGLAALLFIVFFIWFHDEKMERNVLVIVGNASYCIYLTHIYVVRTCERIFFFLPQGIVAMLSIVLSCLLGVLWNLYVENRVQRTLKRILCKQTLCDGK